MTLDRYCQALFLTSFAALAERVVFETKPCEESVDLAGPRSTLAASLSITFSRDQGLELGLRSKNLPRPVASVKAQLASRPLRNREQPPWRCSILLFSLG